MRLRAQNRHPERVSAVTATRWALTAAAVAVFIALPFSGVASAAGPGRTAAPTHASARSQYVEFRSPSKNIYCHISGAAHYNEARCDIHQHTFHAPPKPASCQFDWGQSLDGPPPCPLGVRQRPRDRVPACSDPRLRAVEDARTYPVHEPEDRHGLQEPEHRSRLQAVACGCQALLRQTRHRGRGISRR